MSKRPPTRATQRQAILLERQRSKMARSAHAYVRGSTVKFYEWLDGPSGWTVPHGPGVWICGDCHFGNLGPVCDTDGKVEVQIRDLDHAVIGNPAHDLIRLGLSLSVAARVSDLPGVMSAIMLENMIEGYSRAFATRGGAKFSRPEAVRIVMKKAGGRRWSQLAKDRLDGNELKLPLGKVFWPVVRTEAEELRQLFGSDDVIRLVKSLKGRSSESRVRLLDAAYWSKGCSSLGRLRFAVILDVRNGKASESDLCLMDIKEAVQTAAPRYPDAKIPRDNAQRIVEGARNLSPSLGERMIAARLLGRAVFVRELLPQDLKVEIKKLTPGEAILAARFLANVVGRSHARQMSAEDRTKWVRELQRNNSKSLDAPSWLWKSVVELMAIHEIAYLEYCRKYSNHLPPGGGNAACEQAAVLPKRKSEKKPH